MRPHTKAPVLLKLLIFWLLAAVVAPHAAHAQCEGRWLAMLGLPGVSGSPYGFCATTWDPDGAGPLDEWLVVGGSFDTAGDVRSPRIAAWDGQHWHGFGNGLSGFLGTRDVKIYNGELYVCGDLNLGDYSKPIPILRWDGTQWGKVGAGIGMDSIPIQGDTPRMTVFGGELLVCGPVINIGGQPGKGIAAWNGNTWREFSPMATSIGLVESLDGTLYAYGHFNFGNGDVRTIAVWTNNKFVPLASSINGDVTSMIIYKGDLIVCGSFSTIGAEQIRRIARWDGTAWHTLGTQTFVGNVGDLVPLNNELLVNGVGSIDGADLSYGLIWNGQTWRGLPGPHEYSGRWFTTWHDQIILCDAQAQRATVPEAFGLAVLEDEHWRRLIPTGMDGQPRIATTYSGELVIGGRIISIDSEPMNSIARWNGTTWRPLGSGLSAEPQAFCEFQGSLIAAGTFTTAGNVPVRGVARWNGSQWSPLGGGIGGEVRALAVHRGQLFAGGAFAEASGHAAASLVVWNGAEWLPFAPPLANGTSLPRVDQLYSLSNGLVVAGKFSKAGSQPVQNIARWDGSNWLVVGMSGGNTSQYATYYDLTTYDDQLIAAAYTISTADTHEGTGVARFDGWSWLLFGNQALSDIYALQPWHDSLVVCGYDWWPDPTGKLLFNIGRWDGTRWHALGNGFSREERPFGMTVFNDELIVVGGFTHSEDAGTAGVARWSDRSAPWLVSQPESLSLCQDPNPHFEVVEATGYAPVSHHWRRAGVPLSDGPTGTGSTINGSDTSILTILGANSGDLGDYDCVLATSCGSTVTQTASLSACLADIDCSGFVDGDDHDVFITLFEAGDLRADIDGSGAVDTDDFDAWIAAFEAGC